MPSDPIPLTEDQRALAAAYLPLAYSMARPRIASAPGLRAEYLSAAMLALVEGARAFDPSRGCGFAQYVRHRIAGAMSDAARRHWGWLTPPGVPLTRESSLLGWVRMSGVIRCQFDPGPPVGSAIEAEDDFAAVLATLPHYLRRVLVLAVDAPSQAVLGRRLGVSQSRVSALLSEVRSELMHTT